MQRREIGRYTSYVLDEDDVVVVMGEAAQFSQRLAAAGFREDDATGEWVGTGAGLYRMSPDEFYELFSGGHGNPPALVAQATDGEQVFQVDGLPVTGEGTGGGSGIIEITAVDLETRNVIDEGVSNFRVG